ncbi:MAG: DUF4159 domain-containing protein [Pseudomonadota bacterium]
MWNLGLFAFAQPWILLALAGLPLIWLLLRLTPPAAKRFSFPAIRLLTGLNTPEETPARTPWWLLLLRLLIVALIIIGLAQPLLNPSDRLAGKGPLLLIIDNGWSAAQSWPDVKAEADRVLGQAERENREVILITTAPTIASMTSQQNPTNNQNQSDARPPIASPKLPAGEARRQLAALAPHPWPSDRASLSAQLSEISLDEQVQVVWLSDGLKSSTISDLDADLANQLLRLGPTNLMAPQEAGLAHLLLPPRSLGGELVLRAQRAWTEGPGLITLRATGDDGETIAQVPLQFETGEAIGTVSLDLPAELRNRITAIRIAGEESAGATLLIDERWRRRPVGLVGPKSDSSPQPLLSEDYYLSRALEPFTELRKGSVEELLARDLAVLVVSDGANPLSPAEESLIAPWVRNGGLLLRFAGPNLAQAEASSLLPVQLRGGDRVLGGVLTWDSPAQLAPFEPQSPFANLAVPEEVVIKRQVLAEPSLDLAEKTWAKLSDGTPLVTAAKEGDGWTVLFHISANTEWSELPIAGLFVEMLERVLNVSQGVAGQGQESLAPIATLDGFGRLTAPAPEVLPWVLESDREDGDQAGEDAAADASSSALSLETPLGPRHPPGYYGSKEQRVARNLGQEELSLAPLTGLPDGILQSPYDQVRELDLKPWLLLAAFALLLVDFFISLLLRGHLPIGRGPLSATTSLMVFSASLSAGLIATSLLTAGPAMAQSSSGVSDYEDRRALEATLVPRLAYVVTDVSHIDDVSRAGLFGLTLVLQRRTSVEPGPPLPVDLEQDDLSFFPLLYWPVTPEQPLLSDRAKDKVNDYLKNGGTILFDLRDPSAGSQILGQSSEGSQNLQRIAEGLDIPNLEPVPPDHVLTKAFYLLQDYPGRYTGGTLWVESGENASNDGVTSVVIGANDWASAWAVNSVGQPVNVLVPGGPHQREFAYRFGVNLVMHALTGNYKADQVHIPFILERLGQ